MKPRVIVCAYNLRKSKHDCPVLEGYEIWTDEKHCANCGQQLR